MIPIFDSLCHPTLTGNWFKNNSVSKFNKLEKDLNEFNFIGAAAVGIHGIESYNHEDFMEKCKISKLLYPVAGFNINTNDMSSEKIFKSSKLSSNRRIIFFEFRFK